MTAERAELWSLCSNDVVRSVVTSPAVRNSLYNTLYTVLADVVKGKVHPITGHEGPEGK